jgi:ribonuclease HI
VSDSLLNASTFEELALEIGLGAFDVMLVGDGSGTVADRPCGYAVARYERAHSTFTWLVGAASHGTNNYAELLPYVHALWQYDATVQRRPRPTRVAVVSDSEVTVRCGQGVYERRANLCWWRAADWFGENGYLISWRHVRRNSNRISARADALAGQTRSALGALCVLG